MRPIAAAETTSDSCVSLAVEHWIEPWLLDSLDSSTTRLFCFPFAGGAASIYRDWHRFLPPHVRPIPVLLPGRENRWSEPAYSELHPLIAALSTVLSAVVRQPYALFGHSMGALIAFEMARTLTRTGCAAPNRLFVSGCRAPHMPDRDKPMAACPDREFLAELKRLNGIPAEVMENVELMQLLLPMLRADFHLFEAYEYRREQPLECPISAFAGDADRKTPPDDVMAWRLHTRDRFVGRVLGGDHFFLKSSKADLLQGIADDLRGS